MTESTKPGNVVMESKSKKEMNSSPSSMAAPLHIMIMSQPDHFKG